MLIPKHKTIHWIILQLIITKIVVLTNTDNTLSFGTDFLQPNLTLRELTSYVMARFSLFNDSSICEIKMISQLAYFRSKTKLWSCI